MTNYVSNRSRSQIKPHSTKSAEITRLFVAVGWIGQRRARLPYVRSVPVFDKGPGIGR